MSGLYAGSQSSTGACAWVGFVDGEAGEPVEYMQVNSSPCRRFQSDDGFTPQPEVWRRYAGWYLGVEKVAVRVAGDQLLCYSEEVDREMVCAPLSNTTFASDVGLVEFQTGADGGVPALEFGRVYALAREEGLEPSQP